MGAMDQVANRPTRATMTNLRTLETLELPANPLTFEYSISVDWNKLDVLGLSHKPMQYGATDNVSIPLVVEASEYRGDSATTLKDFERFLQSLCYADADAGGILSGAPPRVLLVWPNVVSMQVVLESLKVKYETFSLEDGHVTRLTATYNITEIRDVRLSSDEARANGLWRPPVTTTVTPAVGDVAVA